MKKLAVALLCATICNVRPLVAQSVNPSFYSDLKWRMIGPFRGGRTVGACGDKTHPNVFYMGVNNGGVWKTDDYGRTWKPIFDDQPTGSIGDVAVAPSNPNTIYVASGEGLQRPDLSEGDGIYKSTNAGKTWQHLGLRDGLQIGGLAVDSKNENRIFAAVLGHPYGPNEERGVYRSLDGGKTWKQVLYLDENTGAIQVTIDPADPKIVFADLWASRLAPWENGQWAGPGSGLYKSTDGGNTWKQLKNGLPSFDSGLGRIGFCFAPSDHRRMYATVSANDRNGGIYRSDDAGETWRKMDGDKRLWDRGDDFAEIKADPKNPDIVYDANVVTWKSIDGGKTWTGWKGAPGGDDYHRLWINPDNPDVILLAGDQGAGITVNGGRTWSSWYNQPTAQLYHVSADNDFPYNVYSGQQESGSVGIASRGNDGVITFRDWHPVNAEEYGYVVADPKDPNIVYGGKISRYDKRTGQSQNISPDIIGSGKYRFLRTAPIVFSPIDSTTLFFAGNVLFKTRDGGRSWHVISPDLTRTSYDIPECIGVYKKGYMRTMPQRGVIYTIALSPLDSNIIWTGTDDGLIYVTHDGGKNWRDVTPPAVTSWSKISLMEASHFDAHTAYAAVNRIRLDDQKPHIYKTTDDGVTWKEIVNGLPDDPVNVVKEDPQTPGLLFAGSERAVYVSFDSGNHWQSLRMNMPATSIRDLVIKDNDIIVATHGRSFWIMDDIMPLRDIANGRAHGASILYSTETAYRLRWNLNTDTPLPPDEPAGENPPDGAIIDYYLEDSAIHLELAIFDSENHVVYAFSSDDTLYSVPQMNIPNYWIRPQRKLPRGRGMHRILWDMHYRPLNEPISYSMSAIYENTPPASNAPWAMPGHYTLKLKADFLSKKRKKPLALASGNLKLVMDPRVKTPRQDLQLQHDLSLQCYNDIDFLLGLIAETKEYITKLQHAKNKAKGDDKYHIENLVTKGNELLSGSNSLSAIAGRLQAVLGNITAVDTRPTTQCTEAFYKTHDGYLQKCQEWGAWEHELKTVVKE